jgi:hypothetical protein
MVAIKKQLFYPFMRCCLQFQESIKSILILESEVNAFEES